MKTRECENCGGGGRRKKCRDCGRYVCRDCETPPNIFCDHGNIPYWAIEKNVDINKLYKNRLKSQRGLRL